MRLLIALLLLASTAQAATKPQILCINKDNSKISVRQKCLGSEVRLNGTNLGAWAGDIWSACRVASFTASGTDVVGTDAQCERGEYLLNWGWKIAPVIRTTPRWAEFLSDDYGMVNGLQVIFQSESGWENTFFTAIVRLTCCIN